MRVAQPLPAATTYAVPLPPWRQHSLGPTPIPHCAELAGARQKDREVNERTFHTWMNVSAVVFFPGVGGRRCRSLAAQRSEPGRVGAPHPPPHPAASRSLLHAPPSRSWPACWRCLMARRPSRASAGRRCWSWRGGGGSACSPPSRRPEFQGDSGCRLHSRSS